MNIGEKVQDGSLIEEAKEIYLTLGSIASKADKKIREGK